MKPQNLRDELATRIDLAGDRLARLAVSYGLLLRVAYPASYAVTPPRTSWGWSYWVGSLASRIGFAGGVPSGRWTVMILATLGIAVVASGLLVIAGR
jgi:hypothetical protein